MNNSSIPESEDKNVNASEVIYEFTMQRDKELNKLIFLLLTRVKEKGFKAISIEEVLSLEMSIDSNEDYDVIDNFKKSARDLQNQLEENSFIGMPEKKMLKELEKKFSQHMLNRVIKRVLLYRELGYLAEADSFEGRLKKLCKKKNVKAKTLLILLDPKKEKDKKKFQENTPELDVLGYDETYHVWLTHKGHIERLSASLMTRELEIIFGSKVDIDEIKEKIQQLSSEKGRFEVKRTIGQGIHLIDDTWVIVSGKKAVSIDKNTLQKEELKRPLYKDHLISKSGEEWLDLSLIKPNKSNQSLKGCFSEVKSIVSDWAWRQKGIDSYVTAFVMLNLFQQAMKPWRPLLYLSGTQGTGKTMFSQFLDRLYYGFSKILDKTSAHAIKQTFGDNSMIGFLDEFEHYESEKRQKDILNLLKTSCAGGTVSFGTTGKTARSCHFSHLFWLASISFPKCVETDGALRDRLIVFDLEKKDCKFLALPSHKELEGLGVGIINAIMKNWVALEEKVQNTLKAENISKQLSPDIQSRHVENFVWASSLIDLVKPDKPQKHVVPKWAITKKENDGDRILEELLHTKVKDGLNEYFIADLVLRACLNLENTNHGEEALEILRLNYVTVVRHNQELCMGIQNTKLSQFFEKKELFSGLDIKTILSRLDFVNVGNVRFGMSVLKALIIPLKEIDRILGRTPAPELYTKVNTCEKDEEETMY